MVLQAASANRTLLPEEAQPGPKSRHVAFRRPFPISQSGDCVTVMTTLSAPPAPADALFTELYDKLRGLAKRELRRNGGVTLSATTLLHDAYLDMSGRDGTVFPDLNQFMGYAARVMRGIIIDHVRSRQAQKRGGLFVLTSLPTEIAGLAPDARTLSRVSEALDELATTDPRLARIVDLKFFCGFSFLEIAAMSGLSERTVQRDWEKARIYLHHALQS